MSLIPWRPLPDFERFFEDDDWFLPVVPRGSATMPAMDVYETDTDVIVKVNIPGFDPEKVEVLIEDGVLKVNGKMEEKKEEKEKGYLRKEIRQGSFERLVRLPSAVKDDKITAEYEKGVLKIIMPKAEIKLGAKVKIDVKGK